VCILVIIYIISILDKPRSYIPRPTLDEILLNKIVKMLGVLGDLEGFLEIFGDFWGMWGNLGAFAIPRDHEALLRP
jgi:hypothetical protein